MSTNLEQLKSKLDEALKPFDLSTQSRIVSDDIADHEFFDDTNERHRVLQVAVKAARDFRAAKIRQVA